MFWDRIQQKGIEKQQLINDFHFELRNNIYENENIIDYDIVDYIKYKDIYFSNNIEIHITVELRIVLFINNIDIFLLVRKQ